jgi:branched-chain amino acid transport system substrate-binding protein
MNSVKKRITGIVLVAVLLILSGTIPSCSQDDEESIKIGAVYPLTGSLALAGENARNGIMFVVDIINNEYDLDLPFARSKGISSLNNTRLEIVFSDSQGNPEIGKSAAERLITNEEVVAIIGCYQSAVTDEVSQLTEAKGVPFLTATSTAPSLTQKGLKWFFRTTPDEDVFIKNFYEFINDIQEANNTHRLTEEISYSSDTEDISGEVQRLIDSQVNVIIQASYTKDAILFMQTYKDKGFSPDAILADDAGFADPEFLKALGSDANYIFVRRTWSADLSEVNLIIGAVNEIYRQQYGTDMDDTCARTFTGMLVLADAINRAGSENREAIRKALLETDIPGHQLIMPWEGVRFDPETHQNTLAKGVICQILEQEYHTVWPWNSATREPTWPMPTWDKRE